MKTMTWTAETRCDEIVQEARSEDVVLVQNGRPVAVVMPIEDDDLEWLKIERSPEFIASIAKAREQVRRGECMTHEQLLEEPGLAREQQQRTAPVSIIGDVNCDVSESHTQTRDR